MGDLLLAETAARAYSFGGVASPGQAGRRREAAMTRASGSEASRASPNDAASQPEVTAIACAAEGSPACAPPGTAAVTRATGPTAARAAALAFTARLRN